MNHLLILGAPRSGTSLLSSLLSNHTEIAVLYEDYGDSITRIIAKKYAGNKLCIPNQIQFDNKRKKIISMFFNFILRYQPFRRVLRNYRFPLSYLSIQDYLEMDNIKIVAIIRDGNDVVNSNLRRGINQSFKDASSFWVQAVDTIYKLWSECGDKVFLVTFDDMVSKPEEVVRNISEFLEIEFQMDMLEGYKYTPVYTGSSGINPGKARKNKDNAIDYKLKEKFPNTHEKYIKMVSAVSL